MRASFIWQTLDLAPEDTQHQPQVTITPHPGETLQRCSALAVTNYNASPATADQATTSQLHCRPHIIRSQGAAVFTIVSGVHILLRVLVTWCWLPGHCCHVPAFTAHTRLPGVPCVQYTHLHCTVHTLYTVPG